MIFMLLLRQLTLSQYVSYTAVSSVNNTEKSTAPRNCYYSVRYKLRVSNLISPAANWLFLIN